MPISGGREAGERGLCLSVLDGRGWSGLGTRCRARGRQRGRAVAWRRRLTTAATARARSNGTDFKLAGGRSTLGGSETGREIERTRERELSLASAQHTRVRRTCRAREERRARGLGLSRTGMVLRRARGDAGPDGRRVRTRGGAMRRRKGRHGAGAGWEAGDWGGSLGRFKGTRGGSRRKESAREGPTAADCGGGHRRRRKGENSPGQRESNSPGKELLHGSGNSFQATGGDELA